MTVDQEELLAEARAAASQSYSPYSRFPVGAAVATADGIVVRGCNIENASYGLGLCAERTAIFAAVAAGHRNLVAIAVSVLRGRSDQPETLRTGIAPFGPGGRYETVREGSLKVVLELGP